MRPRPVTDEDVARLGGDKHVMRCPPGLPDCEPAEVVLTPAGDGGALIHFPWQPDEIDVAALAQGGTVWLTLWGGMPPVELQVIRADPAGSVGRDDNQQGE